MPDGPLKKLDFKMGLNVEPEVIHEQIRRNIRRPLPQLQVYPEQSTVIVLALGGPSLAASWATLEARVEDGAKLVTVNGTHDYCIARGLEPSLHIMLDARPHNARFIATPVPKCKYFIASQCHPDVFDSLERAGAETWIWHAVAEPEGETNDILNDWYRKQWVPVVGGSTVGLRTLAILWLLGFRWFHVYGFDACLIGGEHHPYPQAENDHATINVVCDGRTFVCQPWMAKQAEEFMRAVKANGDKWNLNVVGDGLIRHIIMTAHRARLEDKELRTEELEDGSKRIDAR